MLIEAVVIFLLWLLGIFYIPGYILSYRDLKYVRSCTTGIEQEEKEVSSPVILGKPDDGEDRPLPSEDELESNPWMEERKKAQEYQYTDKDADILKDLESLNMVDSELEAEAEKEKEHEVEDSYLGLDPEIVKEFTKNGTSLYEETDW